MFFISPQKLFSFSRYLNFCLDFLVMWKNSLIRKIKLISKFVTSIAKHIFTNVSRTKGNQAMKFCQLVEQNMRKIFLEKSYTKFGGGTSPKSFSEKSKLSISPDRLSKVLYRLFLLYAKLRSIVMY